MPRGAHLVSYSFSILDRFSTLQGPSPPLWQSDKSGLHSMEARRGGAGSTAPASHPALSEAAREARATPGKASLLACSEAAHASATASTTVGRLDGVPPAGPGRWRLLRAAPAVCRRRSRMMRCGSARLTSALLRSKKTGYQLDARHGGSRESYPNERRHFPEPCVVPDGLGYSHTRALRNCHIKKF